MRQRNTTLASVLFLAAAAEAQVTDLVAWYRLDETAPTTLVDAGAHGHDGTYLGKPGMGQAGATPATGWSVDFDAATPDYAAFAGTPITQSLVNDLSVAAWIRLDAASGSYQRVLSNDNTGWSCGVWNNRLLFTTRGILDYFGPSIPAATWVHVAYVFDAQNDVHFYVDGAFVQTVTGTSPAAALNPTWFVGTMNAQSEFFDGHIDDVQWYAGTLTAGDVLALYQNPGHALGGASRRYCAGKLNSLGCTPAIAAQGLPGSAFPGAFDVLVSNVRNQRPGLFFYTVGGARQAIAFRGGTLCLGPKAIRRTPAQSSGGSAVPAIDCSGVYRLDFKAFFAGTLGGNPDPAGALPGATLHIQLGASDSGFPAPFDLSLSDALEVEVGL